MKEYSHVLSPMSLWQHTPLGDEDGFAPHERLPASATVRNGSLGDDNGGNTEALHCETAGVISVEFVCNEEDVWLVLINGAKSEGFNATPNNPVQGEYEYSLPPPLSTPQPVDATSSADRLIVGVRLESGALRPEKVELFVETLLVELEQQSASVVERKYVVRQTKSLKAVELRQCAVEDPCAEAILLPYPIYAPKQSTVALVSFDEAARWQDRHNTETRRLFQSLYSWRIPIHLRQFFNSNNATATLEQINNAADQAAKLKLHKANANTTRTRQFGSGPVSSTRALTIAVGNIVDVCERVSHDEKNASYDHTKLTWDASRLNDVRAGLTVFNHVLTNGDDSLALLDGLCLVKDVSDPIGSTMGFIWEDLAGELQTRATVIKYKFLITELDGSTTTHVISCTPECGFFAHALTTTLAVEIEQLHAELDALRDCIEDKHGSRASRRWERIPHDPYVSDVKSEFTLPKDFNKNQILTNIEYLKARYTTTDGVFPAQPTGHWRTGISSAGNVTIKRTLQQVVKARTVWPMLVKHQTPSEMSDGWSTSPQATGISILHRVLQGTKYLEQVGLLVAAALGVYVTTDLSIGVIITAFNTWYSLKNAPVSSIFDSIVKRYDPKERRVKLVAVCVLAQVVATTHRSRLQ